MLLSPRERSLGSVDAEREVVLFTDADLRHADEASGAAREAQQDPRVVVDPAAGNERGNIRGEGLDLEPGHERNEVLRVAADVAECASARELRVGSPRGLLLAVTLDRVGEPALVVCGDDLADLAERARTDQLARLADHRVAGVVVRDGEDRARACRGGRERLCLCAGQHHRLVDDHVEPGLDERERGFEVCVVGRDDDDEVESIGARTRALCVDQRRPRRIDAGRVEAQVRAGLERALGS